MKMTSDDLISMHKACEKVLEDISLLNYFPNGDTQLTNAWVSELRKSVQALAVVQRDLIKGLLGQ